MAYVYLSLGSNIDARGHIAAALDSLSDEFGDLLVSSVYESESVGFAGDNFLNLVVGLESDRSVGSLDLSFKAIENARQRDRSTPRFSARTLDIDILCVDDLHRDIDGVSLPRDEILHNAFVLLPLAEIAPNTLHPVTGMSYRQHWLDFDKDRQKLWAVDFIWRGDNVTQTSAARAAFFLPS